MNARTAWCLVAAACALACGKKEDSIVATADTVNVTAADIDRDPVALLPSGAIGLVHVAAPAVFQSSFGMRLHQLVSARLPLPPSAGFEPTRDLAQVYVGVYSMQGADVAAVATGNFDPAAIERAADGTTLTPLGAPLVKTPYSKGVIYTSRNVGFSVLTRNTVLFGDETGIRRALDRLSEGRAHHDTPKWVDDVLATPNAPVTAAFDFVGQPPAQALVRNLPFLQGIRTARVLGNFEPPGMNFAGSLTYPDPQTAQVAAANIQQTDQMLRSYSFVMQLAGIGNPIQKLQTTPNGNDTQFVLALESRAVEWILTQLADRLGVAQQPVQAQTGPTPLLQGK